MRAGDPLLDGVDLSGATFGPTPTFALAAGDEEIVGAAEGPLLYRTAINGQPAVVLTIDPEASNLPKRVAFPVLIANVVAALAPDGVPAAVPLGEPLVYEPRAATASVAIVPPSGEPALLPVFSAAETGRRRCADSVSREIVYTDTGSAGAYSVTETDAAGIALGSTRFVVNAGHPRESDLRPNPDLAATLANATGAADGGRTAGAGRSLADPRRACLHCGGGGMARRPLAARPRPDAAPGAGGRLMTTLVWARPDALWLLALVPLVIVTGVWLGVRRGRLSPTALVLRALVVVFLALALAEPLIASGSGAGGAVFVVDRSASISAEARDTADRWLEDAFAGCADDAPRRDRRLRRAAGARRAAGGGARDRRPRRGRRGTEPGARCGLHRYRRRVGIGAGPAPRRRPPPRPPLRRR